MGTHLVFDGRCPVVAYLVPQGGDETQALDEATCDAFTYSYGG